MLPMAESPGPGGHHLGQQRDAHGEFAAHAETGDEAVEREVPERGRERAQAGAERVDEDGDHHRLRPADAIAEDAEDESAGRPSGQEDGGRVTAPEHRVAARRKKRLHRGHPREGEELLVEAVEEPAERGHDEDEPMVAAEAVPPAAGSLIRLGGVHAGR